MKNAQIETLDCTIRDGGYLNAWKFDKGLVREVYRSLSKSGVSYVELGFRSSEKYFRSEDYGLWRFTSEANLADVTAGIKGAKVAVMCDHGKFDLEDLPEKKNSLVELVRVAVHKDKLFEAIDVLEKIKKKGYLVSLQCMGFSAYTQNEKKELVAAVGKSCLDYVYVADSYGSIYPVDIKPIFVPLLEKGTFKVGFHPHNNLQMAFANTIEAVRLGIHIVDTTIYGIGRGAGNLQTEILLSYLLTSGHQRYNVVPVLNCIERYFIDMMKETPWGYQLHYMISGIFNSHPNYSKDLLRRREYSMEDIWTALEYIREMNPTGYDPAIVDKLIRYGYISSASKMVLMGDVAMCAQEIHVKYPPPAYIDRHVGREFLVLANGPSLKENKSEIDIFIKQYDPVILGANYLGGMYCPDYHAFSNKKRFISYINEVHINSKLLIGINFSKEMIREYTSRDYEQLVFCDVLNPEFDIKNGIVTTNCRTISVLLIATAVVMGAKRVFVAGMDGYLNSQALFYDEKFDSKEHDLNVGYHQWNEWFLKQIDEYIRKTGNEGIHIITPTGHKAFYKNMDNYIGQQKGLPI